MILIFNSKFSLKVSYDICLRKEDSSLKKGNKVCFFSFSVLSTCTSFRINDHMVKSSSQVKLAESGLDLPLGLTSCSKMLMLVKKKTNLKASPGWQEKYRIFSVAIRVVLTHHSYSPLLLSGITDGNLKMSFKFPWRGSII